MIQIILAAIVAAFVGGNLLGGTLVYRHYAVAALNQKVADLKADSARYRTAIGIGTEIDKESDQDRRRNDQILADVLARLNSEPEKVTVHVDAPTPLPVPYAVPGKQVVKTRTVYRDRDRPVCVDADSMLLFQQLR